MPNVSENTAVALKGSPLHRVLQLAIPLAITVALVWYMFSKIDFAELWATIRHGVDYKWILPAMGVSVFSHVFRALRWRLQLRALGVEPPLMALCCSIFGTYALNLVFPRLGDVWRCTYISRREHATFTKVLGSMVADRLSDTLTVFVLLLLTMLLAHDQIMLFLDKYPVGAALARLVTSARFWTLLTGGLLLGGGVLRLLRHTKPIRALAHAASGVWGGFASITRMKGRDAFCLYTLAIWGCYFLQLYLAFFAFSCTLELVGESGTARGLLPCLVAFVLSSIGMAVPSNGGLGPWNMCIVFGLGLYGVAYEPAASFSIVVWSAQTLTLVILGIYTAIYTSQKQTPDNN